jgi:hypothetical protein
MWRFSSFLGIVLSLVVFTSTPAMAISQSITQSVTISGVVAPAKYVYVDNNLKIKKIVSNCNSDAPITVLTDAKPVAILPLTDDVNSQYEFIRSSYDLNKIGTVYSLQNLKLPTKQSWIKQRSNSLLALRTSLPKF